MNENKDGVTESNNPYLLPNDQLCQSCPIYPPWVGDEQTCMKCMKIKEEQNA